MTSTLVNQNGSGKVGLAGPDSLSSSSEPFDVVNSLSEDLSNEHIEESVKSMICSCISPEAPEAPEAVQVNLCQKLLFLHQLTHNMTTDCILNYKFST